MFEVFCLGAASAAVLLDDRGYGASCRGAGLDDAGESQEEEQLVGVGVTLGVGEDIPARLLDGDWPLLVRAIDDAPERAVYGGVFLHLPYPTTTRIARYQDGPLLRL